MKKIIQADEFQLTDSDGKVRAILGTDAQGTFLRLLDQVTGQSKVDISLDEKGSHFYLAGENKQQSYLFLKNNGASGVVLIDQEGNRRAQVLLDPQGSANISTFNKE